MKKVAIATDNNMVSRHFGHCAGFTIFEIDGDKVLNSNFIENPGHKKGFLPVFLEENGVNVIIAGGMGQGAIDLFNEKNIDVIVGATGALEDNIKNYVAGTLVSTNSVCHNHEHHDSCGEHHN